MVASNLGRTMRYHSNTMTSHPPISIFALQTPEERARTERLAEALDECNPNEVAAAYRRLGLQAPADAQAQSAVLASKEVARPKKAPVRHDWKRGKRWAIAACLALVVAVAAGGTSLGYTAGWGDATDAATAAQQKAEAEAKAAEKAHEPIDLAQREENVKTRYKNLGIDTSSADRVSADQIDPITVYPVSTKPATELKRIGEVDVSKGTGVKLDVPIVNQLDDSNGGRALGDGCEVASLAMLLQNAGVKVSKEELQDAMPTVPLVGEDGLRGNPNRAFVGDMAGVPGSQGGYSVYHGPVAALAQQYLLNRSFKVVDLTGQNFTVMLKELASGNPCWVITTTSMQPDLIEEIWETPDGTVRVNWMLHSVVVTGYDDESVYINDPYGYTQNVPYDRKGFEAAWKLMGSQAVCIVPTE